MEKKRSRKKWLFLVFLVCLVTIGGIFVVLKIRDLGMKTNTDGRIIGVDTDERGENLQPSQKYNVAYSFYSDDDLDGLSNAEEIIWGSSPLKTDTDGDGFLDGEEVKNGYDPVVAGISKARLESRSNLTLSQKYLIWARFEKNITDFRFDSTLIKEFLSQESGPGLSGASESNIKTFQTTDIATLKKYLEDTLNVAMLPESTSYIKISQEVSEGGRETLAASLKFVEESERRLVAMIVPPAALGVHKKYLRIFRSLRDMLNDLDRIEEDPIQIMANIQKGRYLIESARQIEEEKAGLAEEYSK